MRFRTVVLSLTALTVGAIVVVGLRRSLESLSAVPSLAAPTSATPTLDIERGRYLAIAGNCLGCHTRPGGAAFSGGVAFATSFGTIYSSNITPDDATGVGKWTDDDLRRAMHEGIAPGGRRLLPAFPYVSFTKLSEGDIKAIYIYLRTLTPVRYVPPSNGLLLRQRWAIRAWNALFFNPGRFERDAARSEEWNRGAYLVAGLGHCSACHSPRNILMAEVTTHAYAGGALQEEVAPGKLRRWSGVNLTSANTGLGSWSVDELAKYLKTGVSRRAGTFGPMNEVITNSTMRLTADDVRAMAVYLKSIPAYEPVAATVTPVQAQAGAEIYKERCEKCHSPSGRGGLFSGPPLAGSAVVQAEDSSSLINIILYGPETPKDVSLGAWETMKPYFDVLTDEEVAAVANYTRGSWGNRGAPVSASDVGKQR